VLYVYAVFVYFLCVSMHVYFVFSLFFGLFSFIAFSFSTLILLVGSFDL